MARVADSVKVESVTAHRKRLTQAFLLGEADQRRDLDDGWGSVIASVVLAAVACAGCVGFSFVTHALAQAQATPSASSTATATAAPSLVELPPQTPESSAGAESGGR